MHPPSLVRRGPPREQFFASLVAELFDEIRSSAEGNLAIMFCMLGALQTMKNKITPKDFRVIPGEKVNLKQWPTSVRPFCESKKRYKQLLKEQVEELDHDFLWRTSRRLPERGRIGIFNRSYYEEVLIVRVHPELLRGQGLPDELLNEKTIWKERYRSIVDLEEHLHRNSTRVRRELQLIRKRLVK